MSDSRVGDESQFHLDVQLAAYQTELTAISSLLPSDSPRLAGEIEEHIRTLAESQAPLPPIVVHRPTMRIVDGMHRLHAAVLRGETHVAVRFVDGSPDDAFVLAVKLNAEHGMPLSRKDRVAATLRIVGSHPHWSDRRIAAITGLSPGTVASLRTSASDDVTGLGPRTGRDGRSRPVNSAAGRIAASRVIAEAPNASLREIASRAGIALATARDVRERMRLGQDPVPPKLRLAERNRGTCPAKTHQPARVSQSLDPRPPTDSVTPVDTSAPLDATSSVPTPSPVIPERVLSSMRRDPSLRMTQMGRTLLHLLGVHLLTPEQRKSLLDGVPAHRAADVVQAARVCAEQWLQFANDLELRNREQQHRNRRPQHFAPIYASSSTEYSRP